jgi:hypothetical protein
MEMLNDEKYEENTTGDALEDIISMSTPLQNAGANYEWDYDDTFHEVVVPIFITFAVFPFMSAPIMLLIGKFKLITIYICICFVF